MGISEIVNKCGLNKDEEAVYRSYIKNKFTSVSENSDDSYLIKWNAIAAYAREHSAAQALNAKVCPRRPTAFKSPTDIRIELYESFSGSVPVIYIGNTDDFEAFVTNVIYKGIRPNDLSSTGASFAFGKTTRFIVLSKKPYSNIPASELGLSDEEWAEKSMIIRREHECTHNFTKTYYGKAESNLHDEIIADFFGIFDAFGCYKADYFLRFMGVTGTSGNRLRFYTKGLPDKVYDAVCETAREAARFMENFSQSGEFAVMTRRERIIFFCEKGLEGMCADA